MKNYVYSFGGGTADGDGLAAEELRKEVGGRGAPLLGLSSEPDFDQIKRLLHSLHPDSGDQLTAKLVPGRIPYWDITATIPEGVRQTVSWRMPSRNLIAGELDMFDSFLF